MTSAERESRVEAQPRHAESGENKVDSIDRIALLQSEVGRSRSGAADDARGKSKDEPSVLDFGQNDPLAKFAPFQPSQGEVRQPGADANRDLVTALDGEYDLTRGAKARQKSGVKDDGGAPKDKAPVKAEDPAAEKSAGKDGAPDAAASDAAKKASAEPFSILGDTKSLDPKKPTAVFLDNFKSPFSGDLFRDKKTNKLTVSSRTEFALNTVATVSETGVPHLSETGFTHGEVSARLAERNGFNAVRLQLNDTPAGFADFSKHLNGIADLVDSGKLKLGKGDVVNASVGNNDPTFDDVNTILGSNDSNRITPENISDPKVQKDLLGRLDKLATDEKQSPEVRDWARIMVDTNKAIERLQGQGIEVVHAAANTGPGTVSLEFLRANHELSSFDPKTGKVDKFATDHRHVTQGDGVLPIRFRPGTEVGGQREGKYTVEGTGITFRGEEFGNLNMQQSVSIGGKDIPREDAAIAKYFGDKIGREAPPRVNENGFLVAVASGNSFVNVQFLAAQRERLAAMKRAGNSEVPVGGR